jgi:cobalt-zinc-cadmium efflux system outer membrane protein
MALRQQHGIAAAAVVIANTYPFNPVWEGKIRATTGPESAGITNAVSNEHKVFIDVELRGQKKIRQEAANVALSRTDAEISHQEVALAVRVVRAFDTVVYRYRKRKLVEATLDLNTKAAGHVEDLVNSGKLTNADLIFIRTEVEDSRAQLAPSQAQVITAWQDLYRALGMTDGTFDLHGGFQVLPPPEKDGEHLLQTALEHRADLRARQLAVNEADARLRLERANRWGNPNLGPAMEYDPTRVTLIGVQITMPLPVFNTHRGEIEQREAERMKAELDLRQTEVAVRQDLRAALARLEQARAWVETYKARVLPTLENSLSDIRTLFDKGRPGADLLRVIDVQRKLLKARDTELDAIYEMRLALADLALAVGDPAVAVFPCASKVENSGTPPQP